MLHIIQNDPDVPPGNIAEHLEEQGIFYVIHHPYRGDPLPELRDVSALIVLGGAMGANDDTRHPFLYDLKIFIGQIVSAEIPYLGICLGGQLLAAALGARVVSNRWEELGSLPVELTEEGCRDPLFADMPAEFDTFQWHHDSFDLPEKSVLLASSTSCRHQAFRAGRSAWGTQFHPEVTEQIIRDWCAWDSETSSRVDGLIADFHAMEAGYRATAQRMLTNFLETAGLPKVS
ncbi:MAG: type 1 glutamine amidotransferase [Desulfobacteraceae bacterium]|nr:type 1 glutamine amidotransferase [Desulfobacteraceae bacterium]